MKLVTGLSHWKTDNLTPQAVSISPLAPNPTKNSIRDKHSAIHLLRTLFRLISVTLHLNTPSCRPTLRSASDTLQIPRTTHITTGSCAFSIFGPFTWNDILLLLRQKPSLDSFKSNLKTILFPKQLTDLPCFQFPAGVFLRLKSLMSV